MALKAKVANKVETNEKGLVDGIITSVLDIPERFEDSKGNEISEEEFEELKKEKKKVNYFSPQFEFHIEAKGSQKSVVYRLWTRQNFNNEKYEKSDEKVDYNDFTRLMLQLELIKETELKNDLDSLKNFDVEQCEGLQIQFELEPSKKARGMKVPKLTSIKPLALPK